MKNTLSRTIRLLLVALLVLLLSTAALVAGSLWLLSSETGSNWLAGQVRQRSAGALDWQGMEGSFAGPLTLRGLRVKQPDLVAEVDELVLHWRPLDLLARHLHIEQLQLHGVAVSMSSSESTEPAQPLLPSDIPLPLSINLEQLALTDLVLAQDGAPLAEVSRLEAAARLSGRQLQLQALTLRLPEGGATIIGTVEIADAMPLALDVDWDWSLDEGGAAIPLAGGAELAGQLHWSSQLDLELAYRVSAAGLSALTEDLPDSLTASGELAGSQRPERLDLSQLTLGLEGYPTALAAVLAVSRLDAAAPVMELELDWQSLQWPLQAEAPLASSADGKLALSGTADDYQLQLSAQLQGRDIPAGQWQLAGRGDSEQLQLERLFGEILGGELTAAGDLAWSPRPRWDLQVSGTDLATATLAPDLPGELSLALRSRGELDEDGNPQANLSLLDLSGTLLDYPLQLQGDADISGSTVQLSRMTLHSGANSVAASGTVSAEQLDLAWQLRAADPGLFLAGASGLAEGSGTLRGSPESPVVQGNLNGERLALDTMAAASVGLSLQAGLGLQDPLRLRLTAGNISQGDAPLADSVALDIEGSLASHRLSLAVLAGEQHIRASLEGGTGESMDNWRGALSELSLKAAELGSWQMYNRAALALSATSAQLDTACLRASDRSGHVCLVGGWQAEGISAVALSLAELDIQAWVTDISSSVDGSISAQLGPDGALAANGLLRLGAGTVTVPVDRGPRTLDHGGGVLDIAIDDGGLRLTLDANAPEQGTLDALVTLPALNRWPLAETQPLGGRLRAKLPDLSSFAAWVPAIDSAEGRLSADLQLGGSLQSPTARGFLTLEDGAVAVPMNGLYVHDIALTARSEADGDGLVIDGQMVSGEGRIALRGEADPFSGAVDLNLTGERFLVYNTPDLRALLSPDLQIGWREQLLTLRGRLEFPEASLTPQISLNSGAAGGDAGPDATTELVGPSPDVVIVNGPERDSTELDAPVRIDSVIEIVLGPAVNVNAVGFVSRLPGAVTMTNTPEQRDIIPTASGQVAIRDGTFRAFGQDLDIETGQIIFPNVPATEPEINLRAVRWIENDPDVTAVGVLVTGPVSAPRLTMFSRPPLPDPEIQSYLLTGSGSTSRNNVLSIGTYITPRIYVGYGYNLLESTNEFNGLFSITPQLGVGTNLGEADNNVNVTVTYEH